MGIRVAGFLFSVGGYGSRARGVGLLAGNAAFRLGVEVGAIEMVEGGGKAGVRFGGRRWCRCIDG